MRHGTGWQAISRVIRMRVCVELRSRSGELVLTLVARCDNLNRRRRDPVSLKFRFVVDLWFATIADATYRFFVLPLAILVR